MSPFSGKSPSERNKMIAAVVLGVLALGSLFLAFGPGLFSKKTVVTVSPSPSPKTSNPTAPSNGDFQLPSREQVDFDYGTTPVVFDPASVYAPEPGRNIFAFYEPPPPCPGCTPTPTPKPTATPTPTPPPPILLTNVGPSNVYAGSGNFRLEIAGDKFDPTVHVYFNQSEVPTKFINPQTLMAEIPAAMIAQEGPKQVIVQTPDGKLYSNQVMLNVQAPPKPTFQYIGMISRKRFNNDTAYFLEQGKQVPFGARLNDVVGGRFRVISISADEAILQDTSLAFSKHRLPLYRPAPGPSTGNQQPGGGRRTTEFTDFQPQFNPNLPLQQNIPGMPNNIPRYVPPGNQVPPNPQQQPSQQPKKDADDDDDDGDGN